MSVLKYNNNGTWEGLNIDHASTADSCLYDANGDPITSTYLPRSAGSSAPLTDDLYVYKSSGSSGVYGYYDGTLRSYHGADGNMAVIKAFDSNGDEQGRLSINQSNGYVQLCSASNGHIILKPNGYSSSTGQVSFDSSGQQIGGHPMQTKSPSSAVTAGNSWVSVCSITGLNSSGIYLVTCYVQYTPNVNTSHYGWAGFGSSATSHTVIQDIYSNTTATKYCSFSGFFTGYSSIVLSATSTTSAVSATIATGSHIKIVRIN